MGLDSKTTKLFEAMGIDHNGLMAFCLMDGELLGSGHPVLACASYVTCAVLACSTLHNTATLLKGYLKSRLY